MLAAMQGYETSKKTIKSCMQIVASEGQKRGDMRCVNCFFGTFVCRVHEADSAEW